MNLQIDKVIKGANEKINFFEQKLEYINNLRDPSKAHLNQTSPKMSQNFYIITSKTKYRNSTAILTTT